MVIAWKETREARRAVQDALPLLARAERITVVSVVEANIEPAKAGLEDLTQYLRRHQLEVEFQKSYPPNADQWPANSCMWLEKQMLKCL